MGNENIRAILKILIDCQGSPENIVSRFVEVLDRNGYTSDEIVEVFEIGQVKAERSK